MVTGSAWRKNNVRALRRSLGRYLAILAIVALGVGFFAGIKVTQSAMLKTADRYLSQTSLYDYRLLSTLGLTQEDVAAFSALADVLSAEGAHSGDLIAQKDGKGMTLKALSIGSDINVPSLVEGRLPEAANECLADTDRFTSADIGKTLTVTQTAQEDFLMGTELTIVGLCESPLYLGAERGTTTLGAGTLDGFILLPPEAFAADYFSELYILLNATSGLTIYTDEYKAAVSAAEDTLSALLTERAALRYEQILREARSAWKEAQEKYNAGEAEYRTKRVEAEAQLAEARQKLDDARLEIERNDALLSDARQQLAAGKREYENGLAQYQSGLEQFNAAKQEAETQFAEAQAQIDAGQKQLDDSGLLIQYQALLVTKRQLEQKLAESELPLVEREALQAALDGVQALIDLFEQSEVYTSWQQLVAAQEQLDAKRAEAEAAFAATRERLDSAKEALDDAAEEIAQNEIKLSDGLAALESGKAELAQGEADYAAAEAEAKAGFAEAGAELQKAKTQLDDAKAQIDALNSADTYVLDRETNTGYVSFENDSSIVEGIAKIFPLFFFAVAALVCMTTMTRMIDEQRPQIGTLKALGYSDGAIAWKYMSYSGSAALVGCAIGFFGGTWLFPQVIWIGYSMLYDFAPLLYVFNGRLLLLSVGAALLCSAGVTWLSCYKELRQMPSNLMRPKAPTPGKRILLERLPFLWKHVSFLHKVSIRNIVRYKKRLIMMLLGVGGCTSLIVAGLGLRDTISTVVDDQFVDITHYQISVTLSEALTPEEQVQFRAAHPDMSECIFVHTASYEVHTSNGICKLIVVATDDPAITETISLRSDGQILAYPAQGAFLDEGIASDAGTAAGRTITVQVSDGKTVDLPVAGTVENYVYHYAYMTAKTFETVFGETCVYKTAYILTDSDPYTLGAELSKDESVAAVTVSQQLQDIVDNTMKSLDYIVGLVVACACALAMVVLFNLCNISITERVREIATIKVLGFYHRETLFYVFREILILATCGAVVGLPGGWWLHGFIMRNIRVNLVTFNIHVTPLSYAIAFGATILLAIAVCFCLIRKIDRIDMAESLKSVE